MEAEVNALETKPQDSAPAPATSSSWWFSSRPSSVPETPNAASPSFSYVSYVGEFLSSLSPFGRGVSDDMADPLLYHIKQFAAKLDLPEAKEPRQKINEFVKNFTSNDTLTFEEQSKVVHNFINTHIGDLQHLSWEGLPAEGKGSLLIDCIENYIMRQLYDRVMAASQLHKKDEALSDRIASLQFLWPCHLGIPSGYEDSPQWDTAQEHLYKMHSEPTPLGKLSCMVECTKSILTLLQERFGSEIGCDHLLPALIYVVLKSNPPFLHSSLGYILNFRHPTKMVADTNYFFVNFLSAVHFLETLDATKLDITKEDFELGLSDPKAFRRKMEEEREAEEKKKQGEDDDYDRHSESEDDEADADWIYIKRTGDNVQLCTETLIAEVTQKSRGTQTDWSAFPQRPVDENFLMECNPEDLNFEAITLLLGRYRQLAGKTSYAVDAENDAIRVTCTADLNASPLGKDEAEDHKSLPDAMEKEIHKLSIHGPSPTREQILKLLETYQTEEIPAVKL